MEVRIVGPVFMATLWINLITSAITLFPPKAIFWGSEGLEPQHMNLTEDTLQPQGCSSDSSEGAIPCNWAMGCIDPKDGIKIFLFATLLKAYKIPS